MNMKKILRKRENTKIEAMFRHFENPENEDDLKYILKYGAVRIGLIILFVTLLTYGVTASSSENYAVNTLAISNGGTNVSSASYDLNLLEGTIAGVTDNANYTASLGFWYAEDYFPESVVWIISLIAALIGVVVCLAYISRKSEQWPIQLLFLFLAAFMGLVVINTAGIVAHIGGPLEMVAPVMWAIIAALAIAMVLFVRQMAIDVKQ